jgi:hypothetical protein
MGIKFFSSRGKMSQGLVAPSGKQVDLEMLLQFIEASQLRAGEKRRNEKTDRLQ